MARIIASSRKDDSTADPLGDDSTLFRDDSNADLLRPVGFCLVSPHSEYVAMNSRYGGWKGKGTGGERRRGGDQCTANTYGYGTGKGWKENRRVQDEAVATVVTQTHQPRHELWRAILERLGVVKLIWSFVGAGMRFVSKACHVAAVEYILIVSNQDARGRSDNKHMRYDAFRALVPNDDGIHRVTQLYYQRQDWEFSCKLTVLDALVMTGQIKHLRHIQLHCTRMTELELVRLCATARDCLINLGGWASINQSQRVLQDRRLIYVEHTIRRGSRINFDWPQICRSQPSTAGTFRWTTAGTAWRQRENMYSVMAALEDPDAVIFDEE